MSENVRTYEVVVIGGGAAGLSGALTLARARRTVLVVDPGLDAPGRERLARYGGEIADGAVRGVEREEGGFRVRLADGSEARARRLLVTTGPAAEPPDLPDLPGLAERWGRDVLHDPYEQGWELSDRRIAVLATGPAAAGQALLWRQWSAHVTLLLHTAAEPAPEEYDRLAARDVTLVNGKVTGLEVTGDALSGVTMADGRTVACQALAVTPRAALPGFPDGLETSVWTVSGSSDDGVRAARSINADLVDEEARSAVLERPVPFSAEAEREVAGGVQKRRLTNRYAKDQEMSGQEWWDARYRDSDRVWSGKANLILAREAPDLDPGTALDLGCGEGGDAIWLAARGWRVTAADISGVALERAARFAAEAGVADRIDFQRHDFGASFPGGAYDLVSAHYLHSYQDLPREQILRAAARAVAPGGVLLIVGHSGWPSWQEDHPDVHLPGPREVLDSLDLAAGAWEVELCEEFERRHDAPDGTPATRTDNVVKIRRLAD